ncbi:MAG: hypothetical protein RLZZ584_1433 [Pseudomonadota bacterium]
MPALQRYGFVLLPGFGLLGLAGALDVLSAANTVLDGLADGVRYDSVLLDAEAPAGDETSVPASCGARLATRPLARAPALDAVFVVADGPCSPREPSSGRLLPWLREREATGAVLGGLGSGAAWLAEAGLLEGYRATVHWPQIAPLAERHAEVMVSQQLYEIDRKRLSCAGHQASRDLLIAWLAQHHGERLGHELAAHFGLERLRGRDERQRVPLAARLTVHASGGSAKLAEAVSLMEANLAEPLPTEEIARLVGVSRRQLERLFGQHLDALPSRWYLELRLQRARRLLRQTHQSVLQIGLACGFASGPHFSNAYRTHFGHTPRDERSQRAAAWRSGTPDLGSATASEEEETR